TLRPTTAVRDDRSAVDAVATGRWVNGGHPQFAVAGVVVRASLSDLLDGIIGIGNDLNFYFPAGSFGSPSLLIREIAIAPAWS
ncbi:MAG: metallopeptidase TldD-related protein, partial [Acidobacteriota bacterium]